MRRSILVLKELNQIGVRLRKHQNEIKIKHQPVITVPAEAFDVQTQNVRKSSYPEALGRALLLFTVAAVIKLGFCQFLDGDEA